ncbi:hypothetical protein [Streptomyces viridosporus]|uniref:hypothetical protein n=1 Tax=Streptomyces viridosporus TaxID=67581 RepID=UPI00168CFEDE|nr:hypothetical protein [Streptomyces viridosporus]
MGGGSAGRVRPCKWCHAPVRQPRSWWRRRRYCSKRHRRWYRCWQAVWTFLDSL